MRDMNILVATNDGYIFPTMVMIKSIDKNKNKDIFIHVYVLYSELSSDSIKNLNSLNKQDLDINYLRVNDALFDNAPIYEYFSKETYFRLVAHTLLPENMDRIMWIDGDIIIKKPLDPFYFQDFENKMFIACEDMLNGHNQEIHKKFNMPESILYFSAGVMLYNLNEMRKNMNIEDIFRFIDENKEKIEIVDQDVLNGMYFSNAKVLENDFTYNFFAGYITPYNYKEKLEEIAILHYCGGWKPWKEKYPYYGFEEFWEIAKTIDIGKEVYEKVKDSYLITHRKWVRYEKTKAILGKVLPLKKIKKFFVNRK